MAACTGPQLHAWPREKRQLCARWWLEAGDYFLDSNVQPGVSLTVCSVLSLLFSLLHLRFCWRGTSFSQLTVPCYTCSYMKREETIDDDENPAKKICRFCLCLLSDHAVCTLWMDDITTMHLCSLEGDGQNSRLRPPSTSHHRTTQGAHGAPSLGWRIS
jgi:hypothetical protein